MQVARAIRVCDVIGIVEEDGAVWDNYQCKHYEKPLTPSDVWVELGKLCYYTMVGEYLASAKVQVRSSQGCRNQAGFASPQASCFETGTSQGVGFLL